MVANDPWTLIIATGQTADASPPTERLSAAASMANDDPRQWSVDRVRDWAEQSFPFAVGLAPRLLENDVDGAVLLGGINEDKLKHDIGVRSLGQRYKILEKIDDLRASVSPPRRTPHSIPAEILCYRSPSNEVQHRRRTVNVLPSRPDLVLTPFRQTQSSNFEEPRAFTLESPHSGSLFLRNVTGTPDSIASRFKAIKTSTPTSPITPIPRKFALRTEIARELLPIPIPMLLSKAGALDDIDMEDFVPQQAMVEKLKSAREDDEEDKPATARQESPKRTRDDVHHLRKKRKTLHKSHVYFRNAEFRASEVMFSSDDNADDSETSNDFVVYSHSPPPVGERLYVAKMLKRCFVNQDQIDFPYGQKLRTVWTLYPERILAKFQDHLVLVFDTDKSSCRVFRAPRNTTGIPETISQRKQRKNDDHGVVRFGWDEENPFSSRDRVSGGDDWDFLQKWNHMDNDTLLPVFGDSDDEDAAYDQATMREMEEEAAQRAGIPTASTKPLDVETIRRIIDKEIDKFEMAWTEREIPKLQKRAFRIYQREKQARTRTKTVALFRQQFTQINARVERMRGEYEAMQWSSERELRPVCGNLQESINLLKTLQWKIELLTGRPPVKPIRIIEDEDEEIVEITEMQDVTAEEVLSENEGEAGDEEEDLDEIEDDEEGDEGNDLSGFIVDDDDVRMIVDEEMEDVEEDGLDEEDDETLDMDNAITASVVESSKAKNSPRRRKRLRQIQETESEVEIDAENDDTDVEDVGDVPDSNDAKLSPSQNQSATTTNLPSAKGKEPMRSMKSTSLPTPPQDEDQFTPVAVKETMPRANTADSTGAATLDGYDSDVFITFGEKEMKDFIGTTTANRDTARDYLKRADGNMERAINMYYEDLASGRITKDVNNGERAQERTKMAAKKKRMARQNDSAELHRIPSDNDEGSPVNMFKPSFQNILPMTRQELRCLKELVSKQMPEDLHLTLNEIAELREIDPATAFLDGISVESCAAYWRIYQAYVFDLFGSIVDKLDSVMMKQVRNASEFQRFYDRLSAYLGIEPSAPSSSKHTSQLLPSSRHLRLESPELMDVEPSSKVWTASSADPALKKEKGKGMRKSKSKPVKPISKSIEEMAQDKELKRIADRERDQRKKGTYMTTTAEGAILINPGKKISDDAVTFHPRLAAVMKPHQIEGAQFIWKHVITLKSNRGTLLAHTMGLGKTLQVIAVLLTLASLGSEAKVEMASHLKKDDRRLRFLVVCPPTIVENWMKEFKLWTPRDCYESLGNVVTVNQLEKIDQRVYNIQRWYQEGGVLIIGYAQFRVILTSKNTTDEAIAQRRKWLLNPGADIVVADEAHIIKNPKAKIGELFSKIKTGSRIATTGSPLSNHLEEYWSMMEWISPGFLGPLKNFADQYISPIKDGLYKDSTAHQRKSSQTRLERLKALLDKKIHRKDIRVIQDDLTPKTEFVISVPLTDLQDKLYMGLLDQVKDDLREGGGGMGGLFKWINLLRLICNHPCTLRRHITSQEHKKSREIMDRQQSKLKTQQDEWSDAANRMSPAVDSDENDELPEFDELKWAKEIFEGMGESMKQLDFTEHSNKVVMTLDIVKEAMARGENVLIFFHSIPTLDYVEAKLRRRKYADYSFRLTGETPMKDRQRDVDRFQKARRAVYLISTRAGSLGLNITSANRVILFDLTWNPVHDQQAVGRAYRLGQKRHVYVYRLGTYGTFEETFFTDNIFKLNLAKRVIDKQNPNRYGLSGKMNFTRYLQAPKPVERANGYDEEMFRNKDAILDVLIQRSKSGKGARIVELDLSETFHQDDEEDLLTNEEKDRAKAEAELEERAREEGWLNDPKFMDGSKRELLQQLYPEMFSGSAQFVVPSSMATFPPQITRVRPG